jgi:prolipoprotein diacylglyceryltransferase
VVDRPADRAGAGRRGGILNAYAAWIGTALVAGVVIARRATGLAWGRLLDLHLAAVVGAIVFGRVGYVATNGEYFAEHLVDAFDPVRVPGLHGLAAFAGATAAALLMRGQRALAPTICLAGMAAALGCVAAGCAVGREVFWTDPAPLWMLRVDWPDAFHVRNPRLPAQWFTAAWLALCGAVAVRRPTAGLAAAIIGGAVMTAAGLFVTV